MAHTYKARMRLVPWAVLGVAFLASTPVMAAEPAWWTQQKRACGLPANLVYNNWDGNCNSSRGGSTATPSYDHEAARRAQQAAEAERQRQAEAERIERERIAEEKRRKDAEFIRNRDATARTLKGSSGDAMLQLKGMADTDSSGLKGSAFDTGGSGLKELRGSDRIGQKGDSKPAPHTDTSVVDARNVPSGLPKSVEAAIPRTPAGERVRKGFQSISAHDWQAALAWFQDALNHEPGSPGLQRLVDLARYTLQQQGKVAAKPGDTATGLPKGKADKILKTGVGEELNRSLNAYYQHTPPKFLKPGKAIQSDTEWMNEKDPAWKKFFRLFTPKFKPKESGTGSYYIGIRG